MNGAAGPERAAPNVTETTPENQAAWRQNNDTAADIETFTLIGAALRALRADSA